MGFYINNNKCNKIYFNNQKCKNIYYNNNLVYTYFNGEIFANGVVSEVVGNLSGLSKSGNNLLYNQNNDIGTFTGYFPLENNSTITINGSGQYHVGAYSGLAFWAQLLNDTGQVIRSVSMGSHDNGYHDPYGIDHFNFNSQYTIDVSGLVGDYKIRLYQDTSSLNGQKSDNTWEYYISRISVV